MTEYYDETIPVPRSADPDTEPKIMIDADLRTITVPDGLVTICVVGDHYAEKEVPPPEPLTVTGKGVPGSPPIMEPEP